MTDRTDRPATGQPDEPAGSALADQLPCPSWCAAGDRVGRDHGQHEVREGYYVRHLEPAHVVDDLDGRGEDYLVLRVMVDDNLLEDDHHLRDRAEVQVVAGQGRYDPDDVTRLCTWSEDRPTDVKLHYLSPAAAIAWGRALVAAGERAATYEGVGR